MLTSKAICHDCEDVVETRREVRSLPLDVNSEAEVCIEVFVCTKCEEAVTIPADQQETLRRQIRDLGRVVDSETA